MQEHIAQNEITNLLRKRLEGILGDGYAIKLTGSDEVEVYEVTPIQVKNLFGKVYNETKERIVAIVDDLREDGHNWITVYDVEVYWQMKQFGDEFEFKNLTRAWPGAAEENARLLEKEQTGKKKPKKMAESIKESEQLNPRYERMAKK
jgi:hypothetical protein